MDNAVKLPRALFKSYARLKQKKYRRLDRMFIVEGERSVLEALRSDWEIEALLFTERIRYSLNYSGFKYVAAYRISEQELSAISDTVSSQGVVAVVKEKQFPVENVWNNLAPHSILVGLDDVSDPGNVGTIIRTCDWFGAGAVLLGSSTVELYNQKVIRSTMGSLFHLPVIADVDMPSILKEARSRNFSVIVAVVEDGTPLSEFSPPRRSLLVFGNEAHGVSPPVKNFADFRVTIPKYGNAESLNVGVAVGIIMHHFCMSRE